MGVETPIPPIMMTSAAPKGAPRRINYRFFILGVPETIVNANYKPNLPRRASERP